MTLSELVSAYLACRNVSRWYARLIQTTAHRFESWCGAVDITAISEREILTFLINLGRYSGNAYTQAGYMRRLKSLLNFAYESGLVTHVPKIPRIKLPKPQPKAWSYDQFKRLYEVACTWPGFVYCWPARIWWPSLIAATYHTASRIGALLQVRWQDVNFDLRTITLRSETTKTHRSQTIQVPEYVISRIKEISWPTREIVWYWPYNRRTLFVKFRKIVMAAELPTAPAFGLFHQIRRTAATLTVKNNGVEAAQQLLGHTTAKTTLDHYIDQALLPPLNPQLPELEHPAQGN